MPGKRTKSYKCFFWSLALLSGSLFFSCANEDCVSIFNNHLLVGFYESEISENGEYPEIDTVFYSVKADGNDLVFYTPDTNFISAYPACRSGQGLYFFRVNNA